MIHSSYGDKYFMVVVLKFTESKKVIGRDVALKWKSIFNFKLILKS